MTYAAKLETLKAKENNLFAQLAHKSSLKDYEIVRIDRACADVRREMDKIRREMVSNA